MTGELLDNRELISSIFLFAGIILHLLNKKDIWSWFMSYCPLLVIGFWGLVNQLLVVDYLNFLAVNIFILAWFFIVNRNNWGLNLNILGAMTNLVIMWTNGGRMPFLPGFGAEDSSYSSIRPDTNLSFFADTIFVGHYLMSPGDIFIHLGAMIFFLVQLGIFLKKKVAF